MWTNSQIFGLTGLIWWKPKFSLDLKLLKILPYCFWETILSVQNKWKGLTNISTHLLLVICPFAWSVNLTIDQWSLGRENLWNCNVVYCSLGIWCNRFIWLHDINFLLPGNLQFLPKENNFEIFHHKNLKIILFW